MSKQITVLGSINFDIVAQADRLPRTGETVNGAGVDMFVGGKGGNQSVQAALLGAHVTFIGQIGDDAQGTRVRDGLAQKGVDVSHLHVLPGGRTGCASIYKDPEGRNMLVHAPGANSQISRQVIDSAREAVAKADVFITQNEINRDAQAYGLKMAHAAGVKTLLNPAPALPLPETLLPLIGCILPNETESEAYTGILQDSCPLEEWQERNARWFLDRGVGAVCITMGGKGAFYCDGKESFTVDAFPVQPVDTTAAGDAFIGGFAFGLAQGLSPRECVTLGCACGSIATTTLGAQNSIQPLERVCAFLRQYGVDMSLGQK